MSLPYPGMVFVPLDILTAEEMNHMVANIEAVGASALGDVLWTNNNPSSAFSATTVNFSGSSYQYFAIEFSRLAGSATRLTSGKLYCPNSSQTNLSSVSTIVPSAATNSITRCRPFSITNSSCEFNAGIETNISSSGTVTITQNNTYFVPTKIIGFKA